MRVGRLRQVQQHLKQALQSGRREQVFAARDMGYALPRIIDDDGQVIAGRNIFAHDDDITPAFGLGIDGPHFAIGACFGKGHRQVAKFAANGGKCSCHIEAQRRCFPGCNALRDRFR